VIAVAGLALSRYFFYLECPLNDSLPIIFLLKRARITLNVFIGVFIGSFLIVVAVSVSGRAAAVAVSYLDRTFSLRSSTPFSSLPSSLWKSCSRRCVILGSNSRVSVHPRLLARFRPRYAHPSSREAHSAGHISLCHSKPIRQACLVLSSVKSVVAPIDAHGSGACSRWSVVSMLLNHCLDLVRKLGLAT